MAYIIGIVATMNSNYISLSYWGNWVSEMEEAGMSANTDHRVRMHPISIGIFQEHK
jgi:hypothetical protein